MKPKKHTILWADDDSDDLYIVRDVISNIDTHYQMVEVTNGKEAVDYLYSSSASQSLPCLVVLDINMPVLNGKDTLALIREEQRFDGVAVAVFTTSSNEKDRQFCKKYGVEMYSKPHTYSEFEQMVVELLSLCNQKRTGGSSLN